MSEEDSTTENVCQKNGPQPGVSYPLKVQYCGGEIRNDVFNVHFAYSPIFRAEKKIAQRITLFPRIVTDVWII